MLWPVQRQIYAIPSWDNELSKNLATPAALLHLSCFSKWQSQELEGTQHPHPPRQLGFSFRIFPVVSLRTMHVMGQYSTSNWKSIHQDIQVTKKVARPGRKQRKASKPPENPLYASYYMNGAVQMVSGLPGAEPDFSIIRRKGLALFWKPPCSDKLHNLTQFNYFLMSRKNWNKKLPSFTKKKNKLA